MCSSVDFPDPDGPITATSSPGATDSETPRRASTAVSPSPYRRVTSMADTSGGSVHLVVLGGRSTAA